MPNYEEITRQIARRKGLDPDIFAAQIRQESGFDPNARSYAGALGIAQIVPKWHPGVNPLNPIEALNYAADHMATLLKKYGGDWRPALSVYNSGRPDKWQDPNFSGGQTYNYVKKILGGASAPSGGGGGVPTVNNPPTASPLPPTSLAVPSATELQALAEPNLTGALLGSLGKGSGAMLQSISSALLAPPINVPIDSVGVPPPAALPSMTPVPTSTASVPTGGGSFRSGIAEAFYDPLGGYDEGKFIGAIGRHNDHVHVSGKDANTMLRAIKLAQSLGLSVRENPYTDPVDPVHTQGSYHYRTFPGQYGGKKLGQGIDVSGPPEKMAAFYKAVTR